MQVTGEELLEKYGLKPNDAVLAEGKQKEMYVSTKLADSRRGSN